MSRAAHAAAAPATKQAARSAARPLTPSPEARIAAAAVTLADHRLLDRVVRGRIWIPLLGVMLSGIVAMQVETLKLGASIGRSLDRTTAMQSRNQLLRASVASLADDQRIERLAARMGMVMAPPDGIGFLPASSGTDVSHAMANIHAPNPQDFLSQGGGNGAVIGQGGGNGAVVGQGGGNGAVVGQGGGNGAVVGAGGAAAGATTVSATSANSTASATATATPSAVGTSGSSSSGTHG